MTSSNVSVRSQRELEEENRHKQKQAELIKKKKELEIAYKTVAERLDREIAQSDCNEEEGVAEEVEKDGEIADKREQVGHQPHRKSVEGEENAKGKDLWKQLKRVSIPVFNGDKRQYENRKSAFISCVDKAPVTPEYKLLELGQYLSGIAQKPIETLGHSGHAYEAAKERLQRKFGS